MLTAEIVAILFGAFGIHALLNPEGKASEGPIERPGHGIFFTTLPLMLVAEFGDKTQIAVAGLASSMEPLVVWIGATAALIIVSVLGVWAGRTVCNACRPIGCSAWEAGCFYCSQQWPLGVRSRNLDGTPGRELIPPLADQLTCP